MAEIVERASTSQRPPARRALRPRAPPPPPAAPPGAARPGRSAAIRRFRATRRRPGFSALGREWSWTYDEFNNVLTETSPNPSTLGPDEITATFEDAETRSGRRQNNISPRLWDAGVAV